MYIPGLNKISHMSPTHFWVKAIGGRDLWTSYQSLHSRDEEVMGRIHKLG